MSSTATKPHRSQTIGLLIFGAIVILAIAAYFYYAMTRRNVDLFTIPNPTQGLHKQQPLPAPVK